MNSSYIFPVWKLIKCLYGLISQGAASILIKNWYDLNNSINATQSVDIAQVRIHQLLTGLSGGTDTCGRGWQISSRWFCAAHFPDILSSGNACGYLAQTGQRSGLTFTYWASSIILATGSNVKQKCHWKHGEINFQPDESQTAMTSVPAWAACVFTYGLNRFTSDWCASFVTPSSIEDAGWMIGFSIAGSWPGVTVERTGRLNGMKCHICGTDEVKTLHLSVLY